MKEPDNYREVVKLVTRPRCKRDMRSVSNRRIKHIYSLLKIGQPYVLVDLGHEHQMILQIGQHKLSIDHSGYLVTSFHKFGIGDFVSVLNIHGKLTTLKGIVTRYDYKRNEYKVRGSYYPANQLQLTTPYGWRELESILDD